MTTDKTFVSKQKHEPKTVLAMLRGRNTEIDRDKVLEVMKQTRSREIMYRVFQIMGYETAKIKLTSRQRKKADKIAESLGIEFKDQKFLIKNPM